MAEKRPANQSSDTGASPGEFLKAIKRKPVVVKLNDGVDYRGVPPGAWVLVFHWLAGMPVYSRCWLCIERT
jgi:hypothetical protein